MPPVATVDDQLKLMEKSYEMAAKYLPQNANTGNAAPANDATTGAAGANQKSNLYRSHQQERTSYQPCTVNRRTVPLQPIGAKQNRGFYTTGSTEEVVQPKTASKPVYTKPKR